MTDNRLQTTRISEQVDRLGGHHPIDIEEAQPSVRPLIEAIGGCHDKASLVEVSSCQAPEALKVLSESLQVEEKRDFHTFDIGNEDLVEMADIPFYSLCEHPLFPFKRAPHIGSRPADEVIGLSKLIRYVCWKSRWLTVQETLTNDITMVLVDELNAEVLLVDITATRLIEAIRGVKNAIETQRFATTGEPTNVDRQRLRNVIARAGRQS